MFVYLDTAMTERELIESTMERLTWWKCIILIWCLIDDKLEKDKKKQEALAAEAANLQAYINQCKWKYFAMNFEYILIYS